MVSPLLLELISLNSVHNEATLLTLPSCHVVKALCSPPRRPLTGMSFVSSLNYHHGCDDGDECVAEGQQSVGGLGTAVALSVGRSDALQERGGGGCFALRGLLLHLLLDVVLYDVAVVVSPHCGGATGPQRTQRGPWTQPTGLFANRRTAAGEGRGNGK